MIEWKVDSAGRGAGNVGGAAKCEGGAAHAANTGGAANMVQAAKCAGDIEWLKGFTKAYPGVAGYSVCAFARGARGVVYTKIRKGEVVGTGARC